MGPPIPSTSAKKEIRRLFAVLIGGVVAAFLVVGWFAYKYSPSGRYKAQNILLSPETLSHFSNTTPGSRIRQTPPFLFDRIEFYHQPSGGAQSEFYPVSLIRYENFFALLDGEEGDTEPIDNSFDIFTREGVSRLVIFVRNPKGTPLKEKGFPFQEVQFSKGRRDLYRIELHNGEEAGRWVYFQNTALWSKIEKLLTETNG